MKSRWLNRTPKPLRSLASRAILDGFAMLYYGRKEQTWQNTRWLGVDILKNPLDLWVYQEILYELRPDLIIETGTNAGGSALYLASLCDMLDQGRVMTIDIEAVEGRPEHPRIDYVTGSSTDPILLDEVTRQAKASNTVMVILDSDHSKAHVLDELRLLSPLVTSGSYLIVEDTNVNGHPVARSHGPGPMEAVDEFLDHDSGFEIDATREKFMHTFNPRGYLQRIS